MSHRTLLFKLLGLFILCVDSLPLTQLTSIFREDIKGLNTMEKLLLGGLAKHFRIIPVVSDEQKEMVYRLRYQIYCEERQYEDAASRNNGMEYDEFDEHSVHSLLVHRVSGSIAGTVRLVLANPTKSEATFPIDQYWSPTDEWTRMERLKTPKSALAEVSRFTISKAFRRRFAERYVWGSENSGICVQKAMLRAERRFTPHLILALVAALVRMSYENNVTHWHAMMEPALVRLLGRLGMVFDTVDSTVEFHGQRHPCFTELGRFLQRIQEYSCASGHDTWSQVVDNHQLWTSSEDEVPYNMNYLLQKEHLFKAA